MRSWRLQPSLLHALLLLLVASSSEPALGAPGEGDDASASLGHGFVALLLWLLCAALSLGGGFVLFRRWCGFSRRRVLLVQPPLEVHDAETGRLSTLSLRAACDGAILADEAMLAASAPHPRPPRLPGREALAFLLSGATETRAASAREVDARGSKARSNHWEAPSPVLLQQEGRRADHQGEANGSGGEAATSSPATTLLMEPAKAVDKCHPLASHNTSKLLKHLLTSQPSAAQQQAEAEAAQRTARAKARAGGRERPRCRFGAECLRDQRQHWKDLAHPGDWEWPQEGEGQLPVDADKLQEALHQTRLRYELRKRGLSYHGLVPDLAERLSKQLAAEEEVPDDLVDEEPAAPIGGSGDNSPEFEQRYSLSALPRSWSSASDGPRRQSALEVFQAKLLATTPVQREDQEAAKPSVKPPPAADRPFPRSQETVEEELDLTGPSLALLQVDADACQDDAQRARPSSLPPLSLSWRQDGSAAKGPRDLFLFIKGYEWSVRYSVQLLAGGALDTEKPLDLEWVKLRGPPMAPSELLGGDPSQGPFEQDTRAKVGYQGFWYRISEVSRGSRPLAKVSVNFFKERGPQLGVDAGGVVMVTQSDGASDTDERRRPLTHCWAVVAGMPFFPRLDTLIFFDNHDVVWQM